MVKDIVVEEDLNPEVDKPGKRKKLDTNRSRASSVEKEGVEIDWDKESTPLVPTGGKPRFVNCQDKHNVNEGETVFVTFKVEGDPVPEIEWFKVPEKDMSCNQRAKLFTDGENGTITMGLRNCKSEDEGDFNCILTNSKGKAQFDFKLFVTVEGGMDFRAMLMKKKVKQKKIVVQRTEWIEPLVDIECQENKDKEVVLSARLSVKGMRGKWYQRNETIMADIRSGEHGRELHKGDKYDWKQEDDVYTLTIHNPTLEEDGTYILLVKEVDAKTSCYVSVKKRDPCYWFVRKLQETEVAYTSRPYSLSVELSEPGVKLKWLKNNAPIDWNNCSFIKKDEGCMSCIYFPNVVMDDSSYYSAQIMEFMKNGEDDQTNCWLEVEEYPHKFTAQLKGKNVVEKDNVEFEITTEADDAEVTWYAGTKKIVPDGTRILTVAEGKVRKLIINNCTLKDAAEITCKTNKDKSTAPLHVGILNAIVKEVTSDAFRSISGMVFAVEREDVDLYVQVKDPNAPVDFYLNGENINAGLRYQKTSLGDGKYQLKIKHLEMSDAGTLTVKTPLNKGDTILSTSTTLDVMMGERKPELRKVGKKGDNSVEGVAGKDCQFDVNFSVEGKKQSELQFKVMVDGKELKDGHDISVTMQDGKMNVRILNPKHDKSGNYKVVMSNAQGTAEQDVNINIMDKPGAPNSCTVNQVFHDNCVVNWTEPLDNGGTEILHYIVEELDTTAGGGWTQVAQVKATEKKAKIEQLENGHKYRFRVRAVNKLGQSAPCEMSGGDILVKDPWNAPSKPGKPNILDWGATHCDLSWAPPESDGGAKITHYVIEKRENNMKDFVVGRVLTIREVTMKGNLVCGTCNNLLEGNQYQFRIKAVNLGSTGLWNYSPPSDPSETMTAKTRYIRASIKDPGMHNIEVKAGKTFRYDIWFSGEPEPDVVWEKDGVLVENNERITIENFLKKGIYTEKNSVLTVTKADRKEDSGQYKIRLCCGGGNSEATGYVNVIDVPCKPRNFHPVEVRSEHCKLAWDKPEDDGGSPILHYVVQLMDLQNNEWVVCTETNSLETEVDGLKPGHLYRFEVMAVNKEGESPPARTKDPVKAENPYTAPGEPTDLRIVDFDEKSVTLRWAKPANDGGRPISHYIIQKKDEFGGWYDALKTDNDNCFATIAELEARVPGLSLGKRYQFRVIAVSKAGESDPSAETKPHLCRYKNLSPSIDQGSGGSKMVKVNRLTCFQVKVKGEPVPTFSWRKNGQAITNTENVTMTVSEQNILDQTSVATLQILRTQMSDAGTYTLYAENKNGSDHVDLDLIVLDEVHTNDCEMFSNGSLECTCNNRFRAEIADQGEHIKVGVQFQESELSGKIMSVSCDLPLCGVVGGRDVSLKTTSNNQLELISERVGRNIDVMFLKNGKLH